MSYRDLNMTSKLNTMKNKSIVMPIMTEDLRVIIKGLARYLEILNLLDMNTLLKKKKPMPLT